MSNYTNENLINVPSSNVPAGTLAMKVGDNIFTAGNVTVTNVISSGTDISSTTAEAADVLPGKLFYSSDGVLTSGTMQVNSGETIIPSTTSQTVSAGQYLAGAIVINPVSATAPSGGASADVYLCTSASDPVYYTILGDTYGGVYYRDGEYNNLPVYTNGSYFFMPQFSAADSRWALYASRANSSPYMINTGSIAPWASQQFTSASYGGKMLMLLPGRWDSGTWDGKKMSINSSGYYEAASEETSGLAYSSIVPQSGQMYTKDTLQHIGEIWSYDYKRDVAALTSSYQNAMRPDQTISPSGTITGPDSSGWFTFGSAAITYSAPSGTSFSAKTNCFTLAFKFKPVSMGSNFNYNWIASIPNIVTIGIDRDNETAPGALVVSIHQSYVIYEDTGINNPNPRTFTNFTFTAGEEYDIVICCDGSYCSIIIDGVRVVRLVFMRKAADVSVSLHQGWSYSWEDCVYMYKDLSLWGRVMTEMTSPVSALPIQPVNMGSSGALPPGATIESVVLSSRMRLCVAGTVLSASVANNVSGGASRGGLFVFDGGIVSSATVDPGGGISVFSGGTVLNVVENGGNVDVADGATASFLSNTFSGTSLGDSAFVTVHSGTTANSITVSWRTAKMNIYDGGSAADVNVSYGNLNISSGGWASNVTVFASGSMTVSSGGTALNVTSKAGANISGDGTIIYT